MRNYDRKTELSRKRNATPYTIAQLNENRTHKTISIFEINDDTTIVKNINFMFSGYCNKFVNTLIYHMRDIFISDMYNPYYMYRENIKILMWNKYNSFINISKNGKSYEQKVFTNNTFIFNNQNLHTYYVGIKDVIYRLNVILVWNLFDEKINFDKNEMDKIVRTFVIFNTIFIEKNKIKSKKLLKDAQSIDKTITGISIKIENFMTRYIDDNDSSADNLMLFRLN